MFRRINIRKIVGLTTAVALVTAGAYAYWTNSGSGSGTAVTGSNAAITVTQTTSPTGLYPGGPAAALAGKFNNGNDGKVYVNDVDAAIASVTGPNIDATHPCDASDYVLSGFPVNVDAEVPAGSAQGSWSGGGIALQNAATNQDGCKGATVNLTFTSN